MADRTGEPCRSVWAEEIILFGTSTSYVVEVALAQGASEKDPLASPTEDVRA